MKPYINIKYLIYFSLFIPLFFITNARAQNVIVDLQIIQEDVGVFYIGDIDPLNISTGKVIFNLHVTNNGPDVTGRMFFEVSFTPINQTEEFSGTFLEFYTNNITVPSGVSWTFNNLELAEGIIPPGSTEELVVEHTDLNIDFSDKMKNYFLETGKFLAGTYTFTARFMDGIDNDNIIIVSNPTLLHLLNPGRRVSGSQTTYLQAPVTGETPLFSWVSDAKLFNLYVYEKLPTDNTPNDVFSHEPFAVIENLTTTNFQYPMEPKVINKISFSGNVQVLTASKSMVRPLQPGKIYYWFIEAKISTITPGVYESMKSEIFQFLVASPGNTQSNYSRIMEALKNILIPGYKNELAKINGFDPNGVILINSKKVTIEELEMLANEIMKREYTIKKVTVE